MYVDIDSRGLASINDLACQDMVDIAYALNFLIQSNPNDSGIKRYKKLTAAILVELDNMQSNGESQKISNE